MDNLFLQIRKGADDKYYIYSELADFVEKFSIQCDSQADADNVMLRLKNKQLPLPIEPNSDKYYEPPFYHGGPPPIYRVK